MLRFAVYTDQGDRKINEDSVGCFQKDEKSCFVLCDGLGGHGMGDAASSLVKNTFKECFEDMTDAEHFLASAFQRAQNRLMESQLEKHAKLKMKTTAVAVVTDERNAYIGHIGDSRLYIFKGNKVKRRTLDHSIPQMLVLSKDIKESEIRNHPDRNIVLRVMGVEWEEPMYELMPSINLKKCQAFLLCSDGFWELIEEKEMCNLLKKSESPNQWLREMCEIVKINGNGRNMDNFSAIAVWNI